MARKPCPFRAHVERVSAAQAASGPSAPGALPSPENGPAASEYQLMLAAMGEDLRQLSNTQSVERKIELKRVMIDRYRPWLEGALSAERAAQDEIVTTMLVWSIDIGDWRLALDLGTHVITNGLALPERYRRTPGTLIAEECAEAGLTNPPTIDLATLQKVEALTDPTDMPDQVRAKMQKAIGLSFKVQADAFDPTAESGVAGGKPALIAMALAHLSRALSLDGKCGVKKLIEGLEREARNLAEVRT